MINTWLTGEYDSKKSSQYEHQPTAGGPLEANVKITQLLKRYWLNHEDTVNNSHLLTVVLCVSLLSELHLVECVVG